MYPYTWGCLHNSFLLWQVFCVLTKAICWVLDVWQREQRELLWVCNFQMLPPDGEMHLPKAAKTVLKNITSHVTAEEISDDILLSVQWSQTLDIKDPQQDISIHTWTRKDVQTTESDRFSAISDVHFDMRVDFIKYMLIAEFDTSSTL